MCVSCDNLPRLNSISPIPLPVRWVVGLVGHAEAGADHLVPVSAVVSVAAPRGVVGHLQCHLPTSPSPWRLATARLQLLLHPF